MEIDTLKTWIGRQDQASEVLTPELAKRFNAVFDRDDSAEEGAIAPSLIHLCLALNVAPTAQLAKDGHPKRTGFLPPVTLPSRMWAGSTFEFVNPIIVGERIVRESTIKDVALKTGRSGELCFVTVEHEIMSGENLAVKERQNIVYRETSTAPIEIPTTTASVAAVHSRRIKPTNALLFRYSALTMNAHRIHYDLPYAQNEEGYPGLVVHGPMQAMLLCHFAEELLGKPPKQFNFRAMAPVFNTHDFTLNTGHELDGKLQLWTGQEHNAYALEAVAEW